MQICKNSAMCELEKFNALYTFIFKAELFQIKIEIIYRNFFKNLTITSRDWKRIILDAKKYFTMVFEFECLSVFILPPSSDFFFIRFPVKKFKNKIFVKNLNMKHFPKLSREIRKGLKSIISDLLLILMSLYSVYSDIF